MVPSARPALMLVCTLALTTATRAAAAPPFPVPTPEEREALRKSHFRLTGLNAPLTEQQQTIAAAQDDVDIRKYFLDLEFIPNTRTVTGSVTITGASLVAGFQHLVLDLASNMAISAVKRGNTSLAFVRNGDLVDITLDQAFGPGQTFDVVVTYAGNPQASGFGSVSWKKRDFSALGSAFSTLSEPEGARSWWP